MTNNSATGNSATGNSATAYSVATFYKFIALDDCEALKLRLYKLCQSLEIKGTILLAQEGINSTIVGLPQAIADFLVQLKADMRFADLVVKLSESDRLVFDRLKVKIRREIVTLGQPQANPSQRVGIYVKPEDWNALITDPTVLVIDTRNDFEVNIGTFQHAENPHTNSFRDFPDYVAAHCDPALHKKVAMFCTGGIRCEKASAYMLSQGFEQVYHLEGGILKYLETVPESESLWQGECFVFDQRVAVTQGVKPGSYRACHSCGNPLSPEDLASPHYEAGIACPHCYDRLTDDQRQRFTERQRQLELKRRRLG